MLRTVENDKIVSEIRYLKGKPYADVEATCPRCGGSGHFLYNQVDGTMCLKCRGHKTILVAKRLYEEEEIQKIIDRRTKQAEARKKKAEEQREKTHAERIEKWNLSDKRNRGFFQDDVYIVAMDDSYSIKEELKSKGAFWNRVLTRWAFNNDDLKNEYPLQKVNYYDIVSLTSGGDTYELDNEKIKAVLSQHTKQSEYVGTVGEKISVELELMNKISYQASFGYNTKTQYIYRFKDAEGNLLVWKTGTYDFAEQGEKLTLSGTIKEHTEYNGEKQTALLRCKRV